MATTPHMTRSAHEAVTLLGDACRPGGVTLAFTERTGGVSAHPFASLNLCDYCGDAPEAVAENRRRVLEAMGAGHLAARLVSPLQVHGTDVLVIDEGGDEAVARAQRLAREGVDAVVCVVRDVPVLLCYADCVPVVLVADGGFAVVHSGWRGTEGCISARALEQLVARLGCAPQDVRCYVGPHIAAASYEVSAELAERLAARFGRDVLVGERHLDLGAAVRATLVEAGVPAEAICDECPDTATTTDRFFSYRAEGGSCGRHGALAVMPGKTDASSEGVRAGA